MVRRADGEDGVHQRIDGSWVAQYRGKYRYAKEKDAAKAKLLEPLTTVVERQPSNTTVASVLDGFLKASRSSIKPRTLQRSGETIE